VTGGRPDWNSPVNSGGKGQAGSLKDGDLENRPNAVRGVASPPPYAFNWFLFHTRRLVMLVLSRKLGEKIFLGDNIVLTVVDIDRGKIRLGIEAPKHIAILREELVPSVKERIQKNHTEGQ
jgi:carbon storage regulator